jgi:ribonuclease HI
VLLGLRQGAALVWSDSAYAVRAARLSMEMGRAAWAVNADLLAEIAALDGDIRKVAGHSGIEGNEGAHMLASEALRGLRRS